jgi:hypothetical protein
MLTTIIPYIDTLYSGLNYFQTYHELAEKITNNKESFPAIYSIKGNYIHIDYERRCSYHRKTSPHTITRLTDDEITSGVTAYVEIQYDLRLVYWLPRGAVADGQYESDTVANNIAYRLNTASNPTLYNDLGVDLVATETTNIDTDPVSVWNDEFDNVNYTLPSNMLLAAIDYRITVRGPIDCLTAE